MANHNKSGERTHSGESSQTGWRCWSTEGWRGRWKEGAEEGEDDVEDGEDGVEKIEDDVEEGDNNADVGWFTFNFREGERKAKVSVFPKSRAQERSFNILPASEWQTFEKFSVVQDFNILMFFILECFLFRFNILMFRFNILKFLLLECFLFRSQHMRGPTRGRGALSRW